MHMFTWAGTLLTVLVTAPPLMSNAKAQPVKAATGNGVVIEESARRWLQAMSDYLKTAKSYSFHADIQFDDVMPSGQKIAFVAEADLSLRRPNGIRAEQQSDNGARKLWFDGQQVTLLDPANRTYAVEAISGNTDKALDHLMKILHFTPPLADFLYEDPFRALSRNTVIGFVVGPSQVNGTPCQHLAFIDKHVDWQIWIEDGRVPLPRKLVITYKTVPGSPQYMATLHDWDFTTRLPDSLFQAEIPTGAIKLPFLKPELSRPSVAPAPKQ